LLSVLYFGRSGLTGSSNKAREYGLRAAALHTSDRCNPASSHVSYLVSTRRYPTAELSRARFPAPINSMVGDSCDSAWHSAG